MTRRTRRTAAIAAAAVTAGSLAGLLALQSPAGAQRALAKAELRNAQNVVVGKVTFLGHGTHAERVKVEVALPAGGPGFGQFHGFHVHTTGVCTGPTFGSAGGHWNTRPNAGHGSHTGDLPSVLVGADGTGSAQFDTDRFSVNDLLSGDGSAVVLHAGIDNFGNVPITTGKYEDPSDWFHAATGTNNTGDAGMRYGCGVVEAQ